jgi:uncharacterized protein DUF6731
VARVVKAYQFWVTPSTSTGAQFRAAIASRGTSPSNFEFDYSGKSYLASGLNWNSQRGILTGTVYLRRSADLPSAIEGDRARPLPIATTTDLGEPMCFAYHPEASGAIVHYAHTGPRHSVLREVARHLGLDEAIGIEPVIRSDMLQQLDQKRVFKGIEFALSDPTGIAELRAAGGSVGRAISLLGDLGGVNVSVQITMGHTNGSLSQTATKRLATKLATLGASVVDDDEPSGVRKIKVRGSDGVDAPVEELDLLNAREVIELEVEESHRSIDTTDACNKLRISLVSRLRNFRRQAGTS